MSSFWVQRGSWELRRPTAATALKPNGETVMNESIDTLQRFELGGPAQWALIRGRSRSSPVMLLVQAGPGFPMIHDATALERNLHLEEHFRVVYWDQRGT